MNGAVGNARASHVSIVKAKCCFPCIILGAVIELDMIKDFAEIAALKVDRAPLLIIKGKENALEEKIMFAKRRTR